MAAAAATPSLAIFLRQALLEAASSIYEGNSEAASKILFRLTRFSNGKGNSEQRLMDYWFSALKSRVNPAENPPPVAELYWKEHAESTQLGFLAANLSIF